MTINTSVTLNQFAGTNGAINGSTGKVVLTNLNQPGYLVSIIFAATSSATVGNRNYGLLIKDSAGNRLWECVSSTNQTAGTTFVYQASSGTPVIASNGVISFPLANPMFLPQNGTITVLDFLNIDVADTVANTNIVVQY